MSSSPTEFLGQCGQCGTAIPAHHPYPWCSKCGTSLPHELKAALAPLQRQDPESVRQWRPGMALMVEGNAVVCPLCRFDRFHLRNTWMIRVAARVLHLLWAVPKARVYICQRCGYVLWFMR